VSRKLFISTILSQPWAIEQKFAFNSAPLVQRLLSGQPVFERGAFEKDGDEDEAPEPGNFTITREGAVSFGSKYNPFENAPPGSTGVISISGPIMKYDNWGDPGTRTYSNLIKRANQNYNINSIILMIDSPGGTVDGTMDLARLVAESKKPVVAFVDGMMASAAYWIGSGASEIIANNETADIGSIGTMLRFIDVQPYWEKEGVKFHNVYADASKDKNKDFHDLQAGKYDLVKQDLNTINDLFVGHVKANRPGVKETALSGKMFLANEAIEQGLIDAIGNFDYAVERAQDLASGNASATTKPTQPTNMNKVTLTAAHAGLLALCGVTLAAGQDSAEVELTGELIGKINSALEAGTKAAADLNTATSSLAAKTTELETATARIATLEAEVKELGAKNPGETKTVKEGTDKVEGSEDSGYWTEEDRKVYAKRKSLFGDGK
jgi:protease-4